MNRRYRAVSGNRGSLAWMHLKPGRTYRVQVQVRVKIGSKTVGGIWSDKAHVVVG